MKSCLKYLVLLFCLTFIEGAFRCDYKYSLIAKGWFKHFVVPATWFDARLRCTLEGKLFYPRINVPWKVERLNQNNGGTQSNFSINIDKFVTSSIVCCAVLASPTTLGIKSDMMHIIMDSTSKQEVFTGIHATLSQGDYHTVDGTPLSSIPLSWAENEPDNKDNKESCLTLNDNGELADHPCEETRPYICYRPENTNKETSECGTVDPEYRLDTRTNKCYKFHLEPRNFSRASFACAAEGGHLAVINSDTEATVLKELFAKIPKSNMLGMIESWKDAALIGYYDWGEHGEWRTVHGETLAEAGYDKWNTGEPSATPDEFCGSLWRNGYLNDVWCDKNFSFICEKSPHFPGVCHVDETSLLRKTQCG